MEYQKLKTIYPESEVGKGVTVINDHLNIAEIIKGVCENGSYAVNYEIDNNRVSIIGGYNAGKTTCALEIASILGAGLPVYFMNNEMTSESLTMLTEVKGFEFDDITLHSSIPDIKELEKESVIVFDRPLIYQGNKKGGELMEELFESLKDFKYVVATQTFVRFGL